MKKWCAFLVNCPSAMSHDTVILETWCLEQRRRQSFSCLHLWRAYFIRFMTLTVFSSEVAGHKKGLHPLPHCASGSVTCPTFLRNSQCPPLQFFSQYTPPVARSERDVQSLAGPIHCFL